MEERLRDVSLMHYNKNELVNMVGDNDEFINLLISTYFEGYHKYFKNLIHAIDNGDNEAFKLNTNSIVSSSKSVCFEIMGEIAFELENMDLNNTDDVKDLIEEMENEIEIIKEILNLN